MPPLAARKLQLGVSKFAGIILGRRDLGWLKRNTCQHRVSALECFNRKEQPYASADDSEFF